MQANQAKERLEAYFEKVEAFLDSFIDQDDEQALFISSYLHGHFSVVAAKILMDEKHKATITQKEDMSASVIALLEKSVETAIDNNELNESDAHQTRKMLSQIPQ